MASAIVRVWYNRVVSQNVKFSEVPDKYKEGVKLLLIENNNEFLIDEE